MIPFTTAITQFQTIGGVGDPDSSFDDAAEVGGWPNSLAIDPLRPIKKITVRSGFIVDNISITYSNDDQVSHGGTGGGSSGSIDISTKILVGLSGRAGYHPFYKRDYLIQVSFIVFDPVTETTTVYGPYGDKDPNNKGAGEAFYVSQPLAFAGHTWISGQTGIAGLCMFRKV